MSNPLHNENTFVGKILMVITTLCVLVVALIVEHNVDGNREIAKSAFFKDEFAVISLFEEDAKANERLVLQYEDQFDPKAPISVFENGEKRELFRLPNGFMQRLTLPNEKPNLSYVYAIFKGPHATEKVRKWANANGYSDWNFKLEWDKPNEFRTKEVSFNKQGSRVNLVGFYRNKQRRYLWDGERIHDLNLGITSHVPGRDEVKYYEHYIKWLESVAE